MIVPSIKITEKIFTLHTNGVGARKILLADRMGRRNEVRLDQSTVLSMAAIRAADVETAPNTPPCFFIIEIAAAWLRGSVAAQQSFA